MKISKLHISYDWHHAVFIVLISIIRYLCMVRYKTCLGASLEIYSFCLALAYHILNLSKGLLFTRRMHVSERTENMYDVCLCLQLDFTGLTGKIKFDAAGYRTDYKLDVHTVGLDTKSHKVNVSKRRR